MRNHALHRSIRATIMTALIAVLSQIIIPTPWGIPFTLQTFAVSFCGYLLGAKDGTLSVLLYLLLGLLGVPVFSGFHGSIGTLFGITGGYLFGFIPLVIFCGLTRRKAKRMFFLSFIGLLLCHLLGAFWYSYTCKVAFFRAVMLASVPTFWKDVLSLFLAKMLADRLIHSKYMQSFFDFS